MKRFAFVIVALLRGDQQNVYLVAPQRRFDGLPIVRIIRVNRLGTNAHAGGCGNLVPHQS